MKPTIKKETPKSIIKNLIKLNEININYLSAEDIIAINYELNNINFVNYTIETIIDSDGDEMLTVQYYSTILRRVIIYDFDFDFNQDGESLDSILKSAKILEKEIQKFENNITLKKELSQL